VGISEIDSSIDAGRSAARDAMAGLDGARAALVIVYASVRYDLPGLLAAIREVTGDAPLVGASSSGHFHNGAMTPRHRGVAVLAMTAGRYQLATGAVGLLREDPVLAGRSLVSAAGGSGASSPYAALMIMSCGLACDQQAMLNGVHRATGDRIPVVGGTAGDDLQLRETYVFHGDEVLTDSAVAVRIGSDRPLRVVHGHGWRRIGVPQLVTGVDGFVIKTIGGRSAFEVLNEDLKDPSRVPPHPAGQDRPGEVQQGGKRLGEVGRAFGLIDSDGGLRMHGVCFGENNEVRTLVPVAPYSAVQAMSCTRDDLISVCDQIVYQAMTANQDASVVLAFSCAGRYELLGERAGEEALRLHEAAGGAQTFGLYTYGEFARTTGTCGFHNATITALAL
jgi:hypothetical protein